MELMAWLNACSNTAQNGLFFTVKAIYGAEDFNQQECILFTDYQLSINYQISKYDEVEHIQNHSFVHIYGDTDLVLLDKVIECKQLLYFSTD